MDEQTVYFQKLEEAYILIKKLRYNIFYEDIKQEVALYLWENKSYDNIKESVRFAVLKVTTTDNEYALKGIHNPQRFLRFTEHEKKIIKLHKTGKTNFEIMNILKTDRSCVSETVRKYKLGYFDRFYKDKSEKNYWLKTLIA